MKNGEASSSLLKKCLRLINVQHLIGMQRNRRTASLQYLLFERVEKKRFGFLQKMIRGRS